MTYHDDQLTNPTWKEQYIHDPALHQQPEGSVACASRSSPRFQHQDSVITPDYSTFAPAFITATSIQPAVQIHQPYAYSYTVGGLQHGNQIQPYDSQSLYFDRPTMSAGIESQEAWPSENHHQQQATYTPTYTPAYAPVGGIPLEQPAASHNPSPQTTMQINTSYDTNASSDIWSPGVCPHASCLSKPSDKQKNYREHSDWRRHWYRVHEKQHQCPIDGAMFGTANELKRHDEAIHQTGAKRHYCHVAGCQARAREFNRKDKFQEHNDRWHGPYYCSVSYCDRGYGNGYKEEGLLMDHMRIRHDA
ncbi:uncharacterized protein EAF01_011234 [Botrytis porri]|uniref:C2H2-type domain-containing protein n=1 Tax=Botrytis porri TaxID=87229 RepID=A0A4Z1KCS7_9HELO|nr:uncharacterized protein EAF01_011234 [Botrytis porri]KAF7886556.1 hypothetical protein EAF01_011234 [Botrytis porri]TGO83897.1 hypothetical protein BPOR_0578g00060 [Botrytis porri]